MKILKFLICVTSILLVMMAVASAETTTVMMYMCGTDLQQDCLTDIQEMCDATTGGDIRIVVLAGGAKQWSDRRLSAGRLNFFTIQNGRWSDVQDWGRASMGSTDTLTRFVKHCWQNERSQRNILILWDHGSSALAGLCFDEVHADDSVTIAELGNCFEGLKRELSGFHLDLIGADACLMACYEMAATLAPYADYYVASEELEPGLGWYYTNWLRELSNDPAMDGSQLAAAIIDSYVYACNRDNPNDYLTLSAVDLRKMSALTPLINSLADTLTAQINGGQLSAISRAVRSMYVFGSFDDAGSDMVDLMEFFTMCERYDPATAAAAKTALRQTVIRNYANSYVPKANGMSIFVPMENKRDLSSGMNSYTSDAVQEYADFVRAFGGASESGSWSFDGSQPDQMGEDDYDDGFWDSIHDWLFGSIGGNEDEEDWGDWDCDDWGSWGGWGGYGYGSGFGSEIPGVVIGGSQGGQSRPTPVPEMPSRTPEPASPDFGGIVIGGDHGTQTPEPAATPAPAVPTAPSATPGPVQPSDLEGRYAFNIRLSDQDIQYLSYAELLLFEDFSDEDGLDLDEMGRIRTTWIDWSNKKVYGVFDGTWPTINDVYVVMYEQSHTDYGRRCIVPIMLNNTARTYLVVEYAAGASEGKILGTSEGWGANGLPVRGVTPLNVGDVFTPVYTSYLSSDASVTSVDAMSTAWTVYDDPEFQITWDGSQTVVSESLPEDARFKLAFRLHDIFGGYTTTDFIDFTINAQ